jgi:hypothetical protein
LIVFNEYRKKIHNCSHDIASNLLLPISPWIRIQ